MLTIENPETISNASEKLIEGLEDGICKNTLITLQNAINQSKGKLTDRLTQATQELASFLQHNPNHIYTQSMVAVSKSGNNLQLQAENYNEKLRAIEALQQWIETVYSHHKLTIPKIIKKKKGIFGIYFYDTEEKVTEKQPHWRYKNLINGIHRITIRSPFHSPSHWPFRANDDHDLNFDGLNIDDIHKICLNNGFDISIYKIENNTHYFIIPVQSAQEFRQLKKCIREYSANKIQAQATENSPKKGDGDALRIKPQAQSTSIGAPGAPAS